MDCSFKLSHYKEILELALKNRFAIRSFRDYSGEEKAIILRHDVDFRLDRALEMAKIEISMCIQATYFIRLHSPTYNPFGFKEYKILRTLVDEYGMDIGLHTEAKDIAAITGGDCVSILKQEKAVLEGITKEPVFSVVEHGDFSGVNSRFLFDNQHVLGDLDLAWHPHMGQFQDFAYFADSYREWTDRCPCNWLDISEENTKIQINTHPCYWFEKFYYE